MIGATSAIDHLAAWSTFAQAAVVIVAAVLAYVSVRQAAETREATERPFVVVDFESSVAAKSFINVVVGNYGQSIARDVTFEFDPPLVSSAATEPDAFAIFDRTIPTMVPGKRITLFYDGMIQRSDAAERGEPVPDTFRVTIRYRGDLRGGRAYEDVVVLDLSHLNGTQYITERTVHDVAEQLKELAKTTKSWTSGIRGIYVRTDDDLRREHERWEAEREEGNRHGEQNRRLLHPATAPPPPPPEPDAPLE